MSEDALLTPYKTWVERTARRARHIWPNEIAKRLRTAGKKPQSSEGRQYAVQMSDHLETYRVQGYFTPLPKEMFT